MPYRRKDSPHWWISYIDPETGKQIRRAAGDSHAAAKAEEQRLRAHAHAEKARQQTDCRLDTVLSEYLEPRLTARNRSTARNLARLADHWAGDLTTAVMLDYISQRQAEGVQPATINRELVFLSAAINDYNRTHSAQLPNPVPGLKTREPPGRLRWLTRAEYAALLHAAAHRPALHDFIVLAVNTGLRRGELLNLTWTHVDFTHGLITLEASDTKTRTGRVVPINPDARAALERRAQACRNAWVFCSSTTDGPLTDLKKSFATACRRAGLVDVTPHTLRHTCASWLVQSGIPLYEVARLLGHSAITTTQRYAHLAPDHLRAAVDALATPERDKNVITSRYT